MRKEELYCNEKLKINCACCHKLLYIYLLLECEICKNLKCLDCCLYNKKIEINDLDWFIEIYNECKICYKIGCKNCIKLCWICCNIDLNTDTICKFCLNSQKLIFEENTCNH